MRWVVGIDLGTTHCVLAASPLEAPAVRVIDVPQLIAPSEVAARPLLPSFLYLPAEGELGPQALPWGPAPHLVGELASRLGAQSPSRLVSSAKSWICHGGINRKAPVLPWSAPETEPHVSPFEAQVAYLEHLRATWEHERPPLREQDVVVTVPASFDDAARELTLEAAAAAGLGQVHLLEEPQAAFYDFLATEHDLGEARLVLVVDVGGGTTDLTLLRVDGKQIERIAVGGHLMLGGDNMDAALAHHVLQRAGISHRLDPSEWSALVQQARDAKERLLGPEAPEQMTVAVQRRGAGLIGGTRAVALGRDEVLQLLLDGFVPHTRPDETAQRTTRAGLTTLGLPYVTDPALPRHVAAFLRKHAEAAVATGALVQDGLPRPDRLLLNGGVFNAKAMVERFMAVLAQWYGSPVELLEHTSLDLAVARGAVRHGLARRGLSPLIGGGSARAYYLGVEAPDGRTQGLCVARRGLEEGASAAVPGRVFDLALDRPVAFPLFAFSGDRVDPPGALVEVNESLDRLPPVETVLRHHEGHTGDRVAVTLSAGVSENGTLELYLVTVALPPRRWRLQLSLGREAPKVRAVEAPLESAVLRLVDAACAATDATSLTGLRAELEARFGSRGTWTSAVCRGLFDAVVAHEATRRRSEAHERAWLRLAGYLLRPGFGAPGDPERLERLWAVHEVGLVHRSKGLWPEWWILWRRVAPGLSSEQQQRLWAELSVAQAAGLAERLQLAGALERLPARAKEEAGAWALQHGAFSVLGRLGARVLLDPTGEVVPAITARAWLERLDWSKEGAPFAAVLLARVSGDATRDMDAELRQVVAARLRQVKAPASWVDMVTRRTGLSATDAARVLGEGVPVGLRLVE